MTILEIVLLIIGLCLVVGSFFVSEKLSNSDKENLQKLTKDQIDEIIKDKMADARVDMEDVLAERIDDAMLTLDRKTDIETNNKIMEISEYSDNVLESVDRSHKEVTFMYSMLNEKQASITEMTRELTSLQDTLTVLDKSVAKKLELINDKELELQQKEAQLNEKLSKNMAPEPVPISFDEALAERFSDSKAAGDSNDSNGNIDILNLHDMGLSEVEIAKKLGRGLGEVKFVLGLYKEERA